MEFYVHRPTSRIALRQAVLMVLLLHLPTSAVSLFLLILPPFPNYSFVNDALASRSS